MTLQSETAADFTETMKHYQSTLQSIHEVNETLNRMKRCLDWSVIQPPLTFQLQSLFSIHQFDFHSLYSQQWIGDQMTLGNSTFDCNALSVCTIPCSPPNDHLLQEYANIVFIVLSLSCLVAPTQQDVQ